MKEIEIEFLSRTITTEEIDSFLENRRRHEEQHINIIVGCKYLLKRLKKYNTLMYEYLRKRLEEDKGAK